MSFLLFDYTGSAMKNALYSFGSRLIVSQELDFLFEKTKSSRAYSSHGVLYFFEIFHTCCPYQGLQSFSLVCFVPLNKIEQLSPLEHVDLKLFLTFFVNIYRFRKKKQSSQTPSKVLTRRTYKISEKINNLYLCCSF